MNAVQKEEVLLDICPARGGYRTWKNVFFFLKPLGKK